MPPRRSWSSAPIIFLTGLPITYYAAKYGVDIDLADPRRRLRLYRLDHHLADLCLLHLHLLRDRGGDHGDTRSRCVSACRWRSAISSQRGGGHSAGNPRHHSDQPVPDCGRSRSGSLLHLLPFAFDRLIKGARYLRAAGPISPAPRRRRRRHLDLISCSALAASVVFSLVAQIGEQVDFLRFPAAPTAAPRRGASAGGRRCSAAGPGWIVPGADQAAGRIVARRARRSASASPLDKASEPTQMYLRRLPLRVRRSPDAGARLDRRLRHRCRRSRSTSPTPMPARSPGRTSSRA